MDNNNGNNNQKKYYKKHYHHRGRRPNRNPKPVDGETAELKVTEGAPEVAAAPSDTPRVQKDTPGAKDKIKAQKEGRRNSRNRRNKSSHSGNFDRSEKATKNENSQNTEKDASDVLNSIVDRADSELLLSVDEEITYEDNDTLDSLDDNESIPELLLLDGADGLDLVAEESNENAKPAEDEVTYEVVGVRFGAASKTYYFDPAGMQISVGSGVIVETVRGDKFGICNMHNTHVPSKNVFLPLKKVIRVASDEDKLINEENILLAEDAFRKCNKKVAEHGLDMKLIEATYTHDRSKLIFFFTAPSRVDFRELVKDLASLFKTRIDLRQIGIRDEAKMIGGYGICGRPLCCCSFLPNFNQVSIKMAKEQNLSLNTSKISGVCGRLMCCLKFEHKTYLDEAKLMPPIGSLVKTADGVGEITEVNPIGGTVKVRLNDNRDAMPKSYFHKDVNIIKRSDTRIKDTEDEKDSSN